jgi:hypothetical protein
VDLSDLSLTLSRESDLSLTLSRGEGRCRTRNPELETINGCLVLTKYFRGFAISRERCRYFV